MCTCLSMNTRCVDASSIYSSSRTFRDAALFQAPASFSTCAVKLNSEAPTSLSSLFSLRFHSTVCSDHTVRRSRYTHTLSLSVSHSFSRETRIVRSFVRSVVVRVPYRRQKNYRKRVCSRLRTRGNPPTTPRARYNRHGTANSIRTPDS